MRLRTIPLRWRLFLASSITVTVLFAGAGWLLQRYALGVASKGLSSEIRASAQAYEAVWQARTQVLSATSALMASMSDVRAAFQTRDQRTIHDSMGELWSRVSNGTAVFVVLTPDGRPIASLGQETATALPAAINLRELAARFPHQLAGYLPVGPQLYYVVLTPVYVQTSSDPLLLNVLCAGFRIDNALLQRLRTIAPGSEFAFISQSSVFASTLASRAGGPGYLVFRRTLNDLAGRPVAELQILRPYDSVQSSLAQLRRLLGLGWLTTVVLALLISSYLTRRLLAPVKQLDHAASQIAAGNYAFRVPVQGSDELARFADTFNAMCDSIQSAQTELRNQEQISTIARLGGSLVHDLRNPLAAIYGGAEMLVDGRLPPEQTDRVANSIYKASRRIRELLQDLSNLSRSVAPNLEVCRIRDMVETARDAVGAGFGETHIEVNLGEDREVLADRTRVERVFANLFSNAQESTPDAAAIRIYEQATGDFIDVFVEDSGSGVPAEIRPHLFEPFVTGKHGGMGLGLALSRRTMRDMGGDLALVDSSAARGACFRVRFRVC